MATIGSQNDEGGYAVYNTINVPTVICRIWIC